MVLYVFLTTYWNQWSLQRDPGRPQTVLKVKVYSSWKLKHEGAVQFLMYAFATGYVFVGHQHVVCESKGFCFLLCTPVGADRFVSVLQGYSLGQRMAILSLIASARERADGAGRFALLGFLSHLPVSVSLPHRIRDSSLTLLSGRGSGACYPYSLSERN